MKSSKLYFFLLLICLIGCSKGGGGGPTAVPVPNGPTLPVITGDNVLTMTVNGSNCSANSYPNKPCVTITVCSPGTTTCQTISDILVDTGSAGLRLFKSLLTTVVPTPITNGGNAVGECATFGDLSSLWGSVQTVDIGMGNETATSVPIQLIDNTFGTPSSNCSDSYDTPHDAGFNGILGVGVFVQDCGPGCVTKLHNHFYYTCVGATCSDSMMPLVSQVQNPVAALSQDNNGVILELPSIPLGGVSSTSGYLVLGIGTESNNTPSNVTEYPADSITGDYTTSFNGTSYTSFVDSGSNGFEFPTASNLPDCGTIDSDFAGAFCPTSVQTLTATTTGSSGSPSGVITFQVGSFIDLLNTGNNVFVELGALSDSFDWGLPFHIGRNIYVGINGKTSSLGTGPYWAY